MGCSLRTAAKYMDRNTDLIWRFDEDGERRITRLNLVELFKRIKFNVAGFRANGGVAFVADAADRRFARLARDRDVVLQTVTQSVHGLCAGKFDALLIDSGLINRGEYEALAALATEQYFRIGVLFPDDYCGSVDREKFNPNYVLPFHIDDVRGNFDAVVEWLRWQRKDMPKSEAVTPC